MTVLGQRYWLVLGGIGSVWGVSGRYVVVLGQCRAVLVYMYMIGLGRYGAELVDTLCYWLLWDGTGW